MLEPRPSLRERRKQQTREHLLAAATDVIAERGFQDASIEEIVRAAGTSRATLYAYFPSKEHILRELLAQMWVEAQQGWAAFGQLPDWSSETLAGWLRGVVAEFETLAPRNFAVIQAAGAVMTVEAVGQNAVFVPLIRANARLWGAFGDVEADARALMLIHLLDLQLTYHFMIPVETHDVFIAHLTAAIRDLLRAS